MTTDGHSRMDWLPNFLICGGQRCGTGWIAQCLREHPDVYVAPDETRFFDREFERGLDWWHETAFADVKDATAIGEKTAENLYSDEALQRIFETLDHPKIIVCVRDPATRLASEIAMTARREGADWQAVMQRLTDDAGRDADRGRYAARLRAYQERAGADRVMVSVYEDLKRDPQAGFAQLFGFLGVATDFVPPSLNVQTKAGALENSSAVNYWLMRHVIGRSRTLRKLYSRVRPNSESREDARVAQIRALGLYDDEIAAMEALLGRRLSAWRGE